MSQRMQAVFLFMQPPNALSPLASSHGVHFKAALGAIEGDVAATPGHIRIKGKGEDGL